MFLDNGILFTEKHRPFTKTVTGLLMLKGGLSVETSKNNGIGSLFGDVLVRSSNILERSEFYGFDVISKIGSNFLKIGFSSPSDISDKIPADFEEFLLHSNPTREKFELEKSLHLSDIDLSADDPNYYAGCRYKEIAYNGSSDAMPELGTRESLQNITLGDLEEYRQNNIKAGGAVAVLVGNYDDKFRESFLQILSKLEPETPLVKENRPLKQSENIHVEEPYSRIKQAKLLIGWDAPGADSKYYPSLKVLAELLGGGMSSRYFETIRKELGFAYSVSAAYPTRKEFSQIKAYVGLDYNNVESTINTLQNINNNISNTLTDEEVEKSKNALLGSFLIASQTNQAIADNIAMFSCLGLGTDYAEKYVKQIENIQKDDIINAAKKVFGEGERRRQVGYVLRPQ